MLGKTTLQKIIQRTGRKPISCKCKICKLQCTTPCLGTPEDIEKIIDAGYKDRIMHTIWRAGVVMRVVDHDISMYQLERIQATGCCTFFKDGLCQLHDSGLKPTEGKLSHHSVTEENLNPQKSLAYNVAKEWINPDNFETINRIKSKLHG